jgi:hypothetical protein
MDFLCGLLFQLFQFPSDFEISAKGVFELTQNHHSVMDVIIMVLFLVPRYFKWVTVDLLTARMINRFSL